MSKKSYMDRKNLLSEGFFSKMFKKLTDKIEALEKVSKKKRADRHPAVKAAWRDVQKQQSRVEADLRKVAKELNISYEDLFKI